MAEPDSTSTSIRLVSEAASAASPSLETLPPELLLHICTSLSTAELVAFTSVFPDLRSSALWEAALDRSGVMRRCGPRCDSRPTRSSFEQARRTNNLRTLALAAERLTKSRVEAVVDSKHNFRCGTEEIVWDLGNGLIPLRRVVVTVLDDLAGEVLGFGGVGEEEERLRGEDHAGVAVYPVFMIPDASRLARAVFRILRLVGVVFSRCCGVSADSGSSLSRFLDLLLQPGVADEMRIFLHKDDVLDAVSYDVEVDENVVHSISALLGEACCLQQASRRVVGPCGTTSTTTTTSEKDATRSQSHSRYCHSPSPADCSPLLTSDVLRHEDYLAEEIHELWGQGLCKITAPDGFSGTGAGGAHAAQRQRYGVEPDGLRPCIMLEFFSTECSQDHIRPRLNETPDRRCDDRFEAIIASAIGSFVPRTNVAAPAPAVSRPARVDHSPALHALCADIAVALSQRLFYPPVVRPREEELLIPKNVSTCCAEYTGGPVDSGLRLSVHATQEVEVEQQLVPSHFGTTTLESRRTAHMRAAAKEAWELFRQQKRLALLEKQVKEAGQEKEQECPPANWADQQEGPPANWADRLVESAEDGEGGEGPPANWADQQEGPPANWADRLVESACAEDGDGGEEQHNVGIRDEEENRPAADGSSGEDRDDEQQIPPAQGRAQSGADDHNIMAVAQALSTLALVPALHRGPGTVYWTNPVDYIRVSVDISAGGWGADADRWENPVRGCLSLLYLSYERLTLPPGFRWDLRTGDAVVTEETTAAVAEEPGGAAVAEETGDCSAVAQDQNQDTSAGAAAVAQETGDCSAVAQDQDEDTSAGAAVAEDEDTSAGAAVAQEPGGAAVAEETGGAAVAEDEDTSAGAAVAESDSVRSDSVRRDSVRSDSVRSVRVPQLELLSGLVSFGEVLLPMPRPNFFPERKHQRFGRQPALKAVLTLDEIIFEDSRPFWLPSAFEKISSVRGGVDGELNRMDR